MKQLRSVRFGFVSICCAIVALLVSVVPESMVQSAVPPMTSFQGRLLDGADHPVTGTFTMVFSIYDSPTGGAPLWTESHVGVSVADGLFSVELGSIVPLSADVLTGSLPGPSMRYVQFQLSGQAPLSPRTALLAAPYSLESSRVSGDIETAPGSVTINDGSHDRLALTALGSVTYVSTWDVSHGNSSELFTGTDSAGLSVRIEDRNLLGLRVNTGINETMPYTVLHLSDVSEHGLSSLVCAEDSVVERHELMVSGLNKAELVDAIAADGTHSKKSLAVTPGTVHDITEDCDDAGARVGVQVATTGSWTGGASMSSTRNVSSNLDCTVDANGNGHAERSVWEKVDPTGSISAVEVDVNDDGVPDVGNESSAKTSGTVLKSFFQTGDFPTQSQFVALTDSSGASSAVAVDLDHNGIPDVGSSMDAVETRSTLKTYFETGDVPDQGRSHITHSVDADGSTTEMQTRLNGLPPGTPVTGTLTMSTGVTKSDVNLGNVTDESQIELTSSSGPLPGGSPSSTFRMGRPAINEATWVVDGGGVSQNAKSGGLNVGLYVSNTSGQCKLAMVDGTMGSEDTAIVIDGKTKRFGIGVSQPDYPIEHSSGARLTAAGDWENASDVNLKENFARVKGKVLLEQIESLPISRWNYKADADEVIHIGPTAQDFKRVFGVGNDDKTISTIDPSGIALAAIQELSKQNQKLQEQNEKLQKQLNELSREVEKLARAR